VKKLTDLAISRLGHVYGLGPPVPPVFVDLMAIAMHRE
jgi:hypothetical protein